jgi:SAM-dependent methyltransferase
MSKHTPRIVFDSHYFANCTPPGMPYERTSHWLTFFDNISEHIALEIKPGTVLDAGCAMGFLVENLRNRGISAFGIDASEFAIQNVHQDIQSYCWVGSIREAFPQKYDLIVCIEVLEHLAPGDIEKTIKNLCEHCDQILFSSSPDDYKEATHQSVHPVENWVTFFARYGFFHELDYDATYITPWAMLFRRQIMTPDQLILHYERKVYRLWKENQDLRISALETRREIAGFYNDLQKVKIDLSESENQRNANKLQLEKLVNSRGWQILEKLRHSRFYSLYEKLFY